MNTKRRVSYNTPYQIDTEIDVDLFELLRDNIDDDEVRGFVIQLLDETADRNYDYSDLSWAYHQGHFNLVALINAIGKEYVIAEMEKPTCR